MSDTQKNPIIARLEQFIAASGMTNSQFADRAAIPRPTLSQILHGRNKSINDILLRKLDDNFPQLNLVWLLFGRGEMLTDPNFEFSASSAAEKSILPDAQELDNEDLTFDGGLFDAAMDPELNEREASSPAEKTLGQAGVAGLSGALASSDVNSENKKISSIIVFYTDNSFKTFLPSD